jgi:acyl dehydratase
VTSVLERPVFGAALAKGDVVFEADVPVTRETLVRYAGAAGDFNPIHFSDDAASAAKLPGVLAHGMLTAALALQAAIDWAGGDSGLVRSYETRFTRPVVVPDGDGAHLAIAGKVGAVDESSVRIDVTVRVDGATVLGKTQVVFAAAR